MRKFIISILLCLLVPSLSLLAEEPSLLKEGKVSAELKTRLKELIKKLGDDNVHTRDKATDELIRIGSPAKGILKKATNRSDPEVRWRARCIGQSISWREILPPFLDKKAPILAKMFIHPASELRLAAVEEILKTLPDKCWS